MRRPVVRPDSPASRRRPNRPRSSDILGAHPAEVRPMDTDGSAGTSLSLLERVRAADPQAWQRLVHVYSPLIFSWCRRTGLGPDDAADVMQDVWQAVSAAIGRFRRSAESGTFRGWVWTITRNKLRD